MIKTGIRPRAAHEVPLLTVIASLHIDMEEPATTSESSRAPSTIERSPLDFSNENPLEQINKGDGAEDQGLETMASVVPPAGPLLTMRVAPNIVEEEGIAADAPLVSKRRRKRANEESNVNAPRKVLRKDFDVSYPTSSKGATAAGALEPDPSSPTIIMSLGGIYQPEWGVTNGCRLDTPSSCQELVDHLAPLGYFSELRHLPNEEFLGQFNMTLAQHVAMGSQLRLRFEQEAKLLRKSVAQVARRDQRIQAMEGEKKNLEPLLEAEADMTRAVEAKNAELVKEMESLRAQFTELQVSRDGLSHQVSTLQAQTFANMVSAGITKGFCDGLKYEVEQGEAKLDLAMVKGYDPEAEGKFIATMQALKDLKYPLIDELEKLRDAPMDLLMASSQLKILVYLEVRDPQDPWAVKEEMLLEDAIAANVSRAEKKKKCRIVFYTHGVGSTHHARSDGVPVSVPVEVPQGLAILLADVATQTDVPEEESSPKLTRSKSLALM
ncbi:hypothetical protein Tco_1045558 [Tanacetum coccineum]|uniref:Transposase (Putative), gypsy type n=1 Tax=Tanacetum coccineum TaxID=301880 RepID=A0ABQ5GVM2_9ASTR